jgi:predicted RNA methylase
MNFKNPYNETEKKENGVFYTPEDISIFMSEKTKLFDDGKGVWLDPCCGLGILSICLASIQDDPVDFVKNRLIINERDNNQLQIALGNFREKFGVEPKSFNEDFLEYNFGEDYIIMNPPYFKYRDSDIYAYFLDKASKTTKGFVSINPLSFTNGKKFKETRKNLLTFSAINLYHFDNIPGCIFYDASVRVSIIITHNNNDDRRTTGIIRWKSSDRKKMLDNIEDNIDDAILTENIFYKTSKNTNKYIQTTKLLSNYLCDYSEYPLYIANSPRYFISASTEKLDRTGQIEIFMKDLESYNKALILLNSSYLYWWWRTNDSSMSLTKGSLLTLPWIDVSVDEEIIAEIERSQIENKVYKKNAGKLQENVKHPKTLIGKLNSIFLEKDFIYLHN